MWKNLIEEQGFAIIPNVLPREEVLCLIESLPQTASRRRRAGVRHALGNTAVATLAQRPRLLEIVRDVLGLEALAFRATLFDKSPDANWLVVWHQDTALPLRQRKETPGWGPWSVKEGVTYAHAPAAALRRVLALRIHLDDCTARNGPLRVLPGTHALGVLSDDEVHELTPQMSPYDCVVPQGGVLAMRPLLIHSSSKSQDDTRRRVLHIEYAASIAIAEGLELAVA